MIRRIEFFLGIGVALAAVAAIVATIFLPSSTTGLSVGGRAPLIHNIYARDHGVALMVLVIALIVLLAVCMLLGVYRHTQHGTASGRAIVLGAALSYVLLTLWSVPLGAFAEYPTMLALACAAFALLPSRQHTAPEVRARH